MKPLLALAAITLLTTGCATMTRGTSQAFTVTSEPSGANVRLSNGLTCMTPCALEVKRKPGFVITAEKAGYRTVTTNVASQVAGGGGAAMAGNVLLGGFIGAGVDASNGSMNELIPNPLHIVFEAESTVPAMTNASAISAP